jgi:hypothetical protein
MKYAPWCNRRDLLVQIEIEDGAAWYLSGTTALSDFSFYEENETD